jgi:repressor LexA
MARAPIPPPITRRQRQILDYFADFVEHRGMSPTLEEIAQHFGLTKVTIFGHVAELERKGLIERSAPGISRGLRLIGHGTEPAPRARIPLRILGTIAAGTPIEAIEEPEAFELDELVPPGADVYVLRVRGDSMIEDAICNGDLVLVDRTAEARNGQTVVAVLPDAAPASPDEPPSRPSPASETRTSPSPHRAAQAGCFGAPDEIAETGVTLKRYYREKGGVRLQPANSAMQPLFIADSQGPVEIRGVVIGVVRRLH